MTDLQGKADRVLRNSGSRAHFEFHTDIIKVSPDMWKRRPVFSIFTALFCTILILIAGLGLVMWIAPNQVPNGIKIELLKIRIFLARTKELRLRAQTDLVLIKVNEHRFRVPRNYIITGSHDEGTEGTILKVLWPDMTPYSADLYYDFNQATGPDSKRISISFHAIKTDPKTFLLRSLAHYKPIGNFEGRADGLHKVESSNQWTSDNQDVLVNILDGKLANIISCRKKKINTYPGCKAMFVFKNDIALNIKFPSWYFDDWRVIKSKSENLIHSFKLQN